MGVHVFIYSLNLFINKLVISITKAVFTGFNEIQSVSLIISKYLSCKFDHFYVLQNFANQLMFSSGPSFPWGRVLLRPSSLRDRVLQLPMYVGGS